MTNALFLPDWVVTDVYIDDDGAYRISARQEAPPVYCNSCDRQSELSPVDQKQMKYVDAPVHGRQTYVTVTQTRYKCGTCRGAFWESLGGVNQKRRLTYRCIRYVEDQSLLNLSSHVAEDVGVGASTVRRIAKPYVAALNEQHQQELRAPRLMGMDETKLAGAMRAVFVDLESSWPFELLVNHSDLTIENFLMNLPGRKDVEVVTMDLTDRYRKIVKAVMPQAAIIADRWHVIKTANEAMTAARVAYQKTLPKDARLEIQRSRGLFQTRYGNINEKKILLDGLLGNHKELREPYWIKERFLSIWEGTCRDTAKVALEDWRTSIPGDLEDLFKASVAASIGWEGEILNFFNHGRKSNGIVERRNRDLKQIERAGSNYSFASIRNRALFGKRPKRLKAEYDAKWQAWRDTNPTCITCNKPFDEAAEEAAAKATRHPLRPRSFRIGYKECHVCVKAEDDWWDFGWKNDPPEWIERYNELLRAQEAADAASLATD